MNFSYYIDKVTCSILRRLKFKFPYISRQMVVQRYVQKTFSPLLPTNYHIPLYSHDKPKENIWICWWQGENNMPLLVKQCYKKIIEMSNEKQVILINKDNYKTYIDIPDFIIEKLNKKIITITHFTDILRFALLAKYGGWWMDLTIYPTRLIEHSTNIYTIKLPLQKQYISEAKWSSFLWYLPVNHPLANFIVNSFYFYWSVNNKLIEYFLIDHLIRLFYDKIENFRIEIDSLPIESPNLYYFQSNEALKNYDSQIWEKLKRENKYFKCNWRCNIEHYSDNSYLKQIILQ